MGGFLKKKKLTKEEKIIFSSSVFDRMLEHDMVESQTGMVEMVKMVEMVETVKMVDMVEMVEFPLMPM